MFRRHTLSGFSPFRGISPKSFFSHQYSTGNSKPKEYNAFGFSGYSHLEKPDDIPRLPIPQLEQTLSQYLFYLEPLVSRDSFSRTKKNVEEFIKSGQGAQLQQDLQALEKESQTSWLEGLWDSMYLELRCPLPINVSPFIVLHDMELEGDDAQIERTVHLLQSAAQFHSMIENGSLPQSKIGKKAVDMSQYRMLFSTARIPLKGRDKLVKYPHSRHVIILSGGNQYKLPILQKDFSPVSPSVLRQQLSHIKQHSQSLAGSSQSNSNIGAMTSENRDEWASMRSDLLPHNEDTFRQIDSALTVIALDDYKPDSLQQFCREVFHAVDNRWYDKTQFIVSRDGKAGINMEHTGYDGLLLLSFVHFNRQFEYTAAQSTDDSSDASEDLSFQHLAWNIPSDIASKTKNACDNAVARAMAISSAVDTDMLHFEEFGSKSIKTVKVSPDAFVQMAFQLAFYRLTGLTVSTYESASTNFFYHGRTETVRSVSPEAKDFTQLFDSSSASREEKKEAFKRACEQHVDTLKKCQSGNGVDRHMFVLNRLAHQRRQLHSGYEIPNVFVDGNYTLFGSNVLSTSNVSTPDMKVFGFGPVHANGFGIGYSIEGDKMVFYVSNYEGKSAKLLKNIDEALKDILKEMSE